MSQSGGGPSLQVSFNTEEFLDDPIGYVNDAGTRAIDASTQTASGGLVSYREGKFGVGPWAEAGWQALDEGLGEITGRNMMRDQAWQDQIRIENERKEREKELQLQRQQAASQDMIASLAAGQNSLPRIGSGARRGLSFDPQIMERDFLGL